MQKVASGIGLDSDQFTICLNDKQTQESVQLDLEEGIGNKIDGTPMYLIGRFTHEGQTLKDHRLSLKFIRSGNRPFFIETKE